MECWVDPYCHMGDLAVEVETKAVQAWSALSLSSYFP